MAQSGTAQSVDEKHGASDTVKKVTPAAAESGHVDPEPVPFQHQRAIPVRPHSAPPHFLDGSVQLPDEEVFRALQTFAYVPPADIDERPATASSQEDDGTQSASQLSNSGRFQITLTSDSEDGNSSDEATTPSHTEIVSYANAAHTVFQYAPQFCVVLHPFVVDPRPVLPPPSIPLQLISYQGVQGVCLFHPIRPLPQPDQSQDSVVVVSPSNALRVRNLR